MKLKLMSLAMFAALIEAFVLAPLSANAQGSGYQYSAIDADSSGNGKTFEGTWELTQFVRQGNQIFAAGELNGTMTKKNGKTTEVVETVLLPVTVSSDAVASTAGVRALPAAQECQVLYLEIGPINLSLLGLDLFIGGEGDVPIVIDLDANAGEGLLGDLLCGLAGGPITGPLDQLLQIIGLLNELLGLLG